MSKSIDLRVLKTRKLIRDAFLKLIEEKGFEDITINDISDNAMINRSTFYLHYTDKYDLLDKTVDDVITKLMNLVEPEAHVQGENLELVKFKQNIQEILKTVEEDGNFYKAILGEHGMIAVRKKLLNTLKQKLEKSLPEQTSIKRELLLELASSVYLEAITWWLNNGMEYSNSYMAEQITWFITMGASRSAGIKDFT